MIWSQLVKTGSLWYKNRFIYLKRHVCSLQPKAKGLLQGHFSWTNACSLSGARQVLCEILHTCDVSLGHSASTQSGLGQTRRTGWKTALQTQAVWGPTRLSGAVTLNTGKMAAAPLNYRSTSVHGVRSQLIITEQEHTTVWAKEEWINWLRRADRVGGRASDIQHHRAPYVL